jgi:hypothetical protein
VTKFTPIQIPGGVVTNATKNMRSSNWAEVNLVRWIEGEMQPIGGQKQLVYPANYPFGSRCRMIHAWIDLTGTKHIAYVCEQHVYIDTGGVLTDVSPVAPATPWPGPPGPGEGGYGDLLYGDDLYGTPRASGTTLPTDTIPNVWSVDNFGAILLVMSSITGELLYWDPAVGGTLALVAGAAGSVVPHARCFVVTQERFVMAFGTYHDGTEDGGSSRRFAWSDQELYDTWNYTEVVSQSGFLDVEPASPIIAAHAGKFGVLFFTAHRAYLSAYQGLPYVYGYKELADGCTPWSPHSITSTSSLVLWMSDQGMHSYDGASINPIACLVRPWIIDDHDPANVREQACAVHNSTFNEWWWFFPQNGQPHNTRCVIYNYKEGWWSQGTMSRSAGIDSSYIEETIMADGTLVYEHELDQYYSAGTPLPWAETFDLNLTSGARLATIKQVMPDLRMPPGQALPNLQFQFYSKMSRSPGGMGNWSQPYQLRADGSGYVDVRVTGRALRMKISVASPPVTPFTVGQHLFDFAVRGDR